MTNCIQQSLQTVRFEPCVVVQEKEKMARGVKSRTVVSLTITEIAPVLYEPRIGPVPDQVRCESIGSVGGTIIGKDHLDAVEHRLFPDRRQATLEPRSPVVIEDDHAHPGGIGSG